MTVPKYVLDVSANIRNADVLIVSRHFAFFRRKPDGTVVNESNPKAIRTRIKTASIFSLSKTTRHGERIQFVEVDLLCQRLVPDATGSSTPAQKSPFSSTWRSGKDVYFRHGKLLASPGRICLRLLMHWGRRAASGACPDCRQQKYTSNAPVTAGELTMRNRFSMGKHYPLSIDGLEVIEDGNNW